MKLYDVMKKWATDPDERFYCYQTDEIWRLEGNDMMNEENEIRVVNKYTLNFNFKEIKEPATFMEVLKTVDESEGDILWTVKNEEWEEEIEAETLDVILSKLADNHLDTGLADILLKSDWYIEN